MNKKIEDTKFEKFVKVFLILSVVVFLIFAGYFVLNLLTVKNNTAYDDVQETEELGFLNMDGWWQGQGIDFTITGNKIKNYDGKEYTLEASDNKNFTHMLVSTTERDGYTKTSKAYIVYEGGDEALYYISVGENGIGGVAVNIKRVNDK